MSTTEGKSSATRNSGGSSISKAAGKANAIAAAREAADNVTSALANRDITFEEQLALEKEEQTRLATTKTKVDDDGTVMEWDENRKAWIPQIDDDFIARYQMNYGVSVAAKCATTEDVAESQSSNDLWTQLNAWQQCIQSGVDESGKVMSEKEKMEQETLWNDYLNSDEYRAWYNSTYGSSETADNTTGNVKENCAVDPAKTQLDSVVDAPINAAECKKKKAKKSKEPQKWFAIDNQHNRHVYVSGLPSDVTMEEFLELVKKYGVLEEDMLTRKPKVKLYEDPESKSPRGDARCCYAHNESVEIALSLIDGYNLRGHILSAKPAEFELRGNFDPAKRRRLTNKEKKQARQLKEKKLSWGLDVAKHVRFRREKTVILKKVFEPEEFNTSPLLVEQIRDKVRDELSKFGTVRRCTLYDRNPDGVVRVDFSTAEEADLAVAQVHGRLLRGTRWTPVTAETWDGKSKYLVEETEEQFEARRRIYERDVLGIVDNNEDSSEKKDDDFDDNTVDEDRLVACELEYLEAPETPPSVTSEYEDSASVEPSIDTCNVEIPPHVDLPLST